MMILDQLIADMRYQLHDFFVPGDPIAILHTESERLHRKLARSRAGLDRLKKAIEELQTRLAGKEERAAHLADRVEVFLHLGDQANAWQQALTLDKLRQFIRAERRELQDQLGVYGRLMSRFRRLQERLGNLGRHA
jgi:hypothetical protein